MVLLKTTGKFLVSGFTGLVIYSQSRTKCEAQGSRTRRHCDGANSEQDTSYFVPQQMFRRKGRLA
jgi:hypothetical protein